MRVLVTGGSCFRGGYAIPALTGRGYDVVALGRRPTAAERVAEPGAEPVERDLDAAESIDRASKLAIVDTLVNLASPGFGHAPVIVAATEETGTKRAILLSTTAILTALNASSKKVRVAAEATITGSDLDWRILRPTMIYGDLNMARLLSVIRRLPAIPTPAGGGRRFQQLVHVGDLADATARCLDRPISIGRASDIAGPEALTFSEALAKSGQALGRTYRVLPNPVRPAILVLRLYERIARHLYERVARHLYERIARHPRLHAEQLERLTEDKSFDISEASQNLAFAPRPFAAGSAPQVANGSGRTSKHAAHTPGTR